MKITSMHYKYLMVEAECPECGRVTGSDMGGGFVPNLDSEQIFWCDEHGEFALDMDWGNLINNYIKTKEE